MFPELASLVPKFLTVASNLATPLLFSEPDTYLSDVILRYRHFPN